MGLDWSPQPALFVKKGIFGSLQNQKSIDLSLSPAEPSVRVPDCRG